MSIGRLVARSLPLALVATLVFAGSASAEMPHLNGAATISGSATVGGQLTAHNGTWLYHDGTSCQADCVLSYQWQRCDAGGTQCADIGGATGRFYTVQQADAGSRLRVMETMAKEDCGEWNYETGTRECRWDTRSGPSSPTAVVPGSAPTAPTPPSGPPPAAPLAPTPAAAPEIAGFPMVDEVLTATKGRWSSTGALALNLEWLRCDADGQNCAGLGITNESYTAGLVDVGKTLRVRVTAANPYGARTALSEPTAVVSELKPTAAKLSIEAAKVTAPHRLALQATRVAPRRLSQRVPIRVDVVVRDTRGFLVSGAVVSVVALPASAFTPTQAVETATDGVATMTIKPTAKLNLSKRGVVTLVLTARRPTDRVTSPRSSSVKLTLAVRGPSR